MAVTSTRPIKLRGTGHIYNRSIAVEPSTYVPLPLSSSHTIGPVFGELSIAKLAAPVNIDSQGLVPVRQVPYAVLNGSERPGMQLRCQA